jgi:hypothetical protein
MLNDCQSLNVQLSDGLGTGDAATRQTTEREMRHAVRLR